MYVNEAKSVNKDSPIGKTGRSLIYKKEPAEAPGLVPEEYRRTANSCQTNDHSRRIFDCDHSDRT